MTFYVIHCYNRETAKTPCLVMTYKQKHAAIKRAEKARATFPRVDILTINQH